MKAAIHVDHLAGGVIQQAVGDGAHRARHIGALAHARLRQQPAAMRSLYAFSTAGHIRANNAGANLENLNAVRGQPLRVERGRHAEARL
jgi:hypothetical protein